jgi:hypothetical protein
MGSMKRASFEKIELNTILQLYGIMVSKGIWKDYSISFMEECVIFSVYQNNSDCALFSIKKSPKFFSTGRMYSVNQMDGKIIKGSNDLNSVLRVVKHKQLKIHLV